LSAESNFSHPGEDDESGTLYHRDQQASLMPPSPNSIFRLRKHADYQRVYKASRKQFARQMSYFFALRPQLGPDGTPLRNADTTSPRVGLTVGKVMGKAVDRNRIKRRMREAVRKNITALTTPVDVVLHPRRSVINLDLPVLEREVAAVFRAIQKAAGRQRENPSTPL
jgi:ribonuclease P protein component